MVAATSIWGAESPVVAGLVVVLKTYGDGDTAYELEGC